jgi:hypothetical protein
VPANRQVLFADQASAMNRGQQTGSSWMLHGCASIPQNPCKSGCCVGSSCNRSWAVASRALGDNACPPARWDIAPKLAIAATLRARPWAIRRCDRQGGRRVCDALKRGGSDAGIS